VLVKARVALAVKMVDDKLMLDGVMEQVMPTEPGGVQVRLTVPLNPFLALKVSFEDADCPGAVATAVKPSKVKSGWAAVAFTTHAANSLVASIEPRPVT
jgi:hypothetical protein